MTRLRMWLMLAMLALPAGALAADPGASEWTRNEAGTIRMISAATAVGQSDRIEMGLQFQLEPGWKIYWRTPGDAGYPPKVDWSGSENIATPVMSWPAPRRFVEGGLQIHGYAGDVILPLAVPVRHPGQPVRISANVDYLACADVCVPMQAHLDLALPAGPADASSFVHAIDRFRELVPGDGSRRGLSLLSAEAVGDGKTSALRLTVETTAEPFAHPDAFVEGEDVASFEPPRVRLADGGRRAVLTIPVIGDTVQRPLAGAPLTVTVVDGPRSMEAKVTPVPAVAAAESPAPMMLLGMLGAALIGGLILNLMPCVLPVLSIKVLGAVSQGGAERSHVRAAFLASAAGIVTSFLLLAFGAIAVKAAGQAVGWGIQFQQPAFLAVMALAVSLFAANLWGLFEISLPSWLFNAAPGGIPHHTLLGHFLSGAFATLLATPCSAPFLGTAIGFALARGPFEILAIFTALGIGMAFPYLAVAARPGMAKRLPRPGPWMGKLKLVLGAALAVTALWLLSVLGAQSGLKAAVLAGAAMLAAVGMLTARRHLPERSRPAAAAAAAAMSAVALAAPLHAGFTGIEPHGESREGGIAWIAFDPGTIDRYVASGKLVFVDVTAEWCITCKVNKAAVVDRGEVARRLAAGNVVAMKADWTRPDEGITRYLTSFGRYGVPFNAVYGPAAPKGIALPELLTEGDVLAALDKAAGNTVTLSPPGR
ncbi:MAG: protein-disulfide reductase DsbD family protein [Magnetospirillum sp.]|nr:protein-disulfide reductase DsbD family protein [Magnetospirillum sp.]